MVVKVTSLISCITHASAHVPEEYIIVDEGNNLDKEAYPSIRIDNVPRMKIKLPPHLRFSFHHHIVLYLHIHTVHVQ